MRILSIDFDYFIDTDMETREMCFPDGHDNLSPTMTQFLWERRYDSHTKGFIDLKDIGVISDYNKVCNFLSNLKEGKVLIADSHREIEKFFSVIKTDGELDLIHIDFHHDMYVTGGDNLDCGNWLRFLIDLKPDTKITWIRREDSDVDSLFGEFPYNNTSDLSLDGEFDLIFLCFSSPWTPPHLKPQFEAMCRCVDHLDRF